MERAKKNPMDAATGAGNSPGDKVVALAGNPNVGKSTVFNTLTGMNQHTGNWPGKTVATAQGVAAYEGTRYILVDLPGTYSLMAHSAEEEVARDFVLFGGADATVVVCDATCLERNLNLVLQTLEITPNVVVCVNLMDEAEKKSLHLDLDALSAALGVPVVGTAARGNKGLNTLMKRVAAACAGGPPPAPRRVRYGERLEEALGELAAVLEPRVRGRVNPRWLALRLLEGDGNLLERVDAHLGLALTGDGELARAVAGANARLEAAGIAVEERKDRIVACLVLAAEECAMAAMAEPAATGSVPGGCAGCGRCGQAGQDSTAASARERDRKLDRILTSKGTGIPIMLALLCGVFWLTISGANAPSQLLAGLLFRVQDRLTQFFLRLGTPEWVHGALVLGVYRVLAWVVSVMLPPMAIFFPLFTLLEDFGYLPRVAFNLDHHFQKAKTCGKQALTMCMGFGCNAVGVTGCRIIDSPRERLIAILTNNFVPCNGRFAPPRQGQQWGPIRRTRSGAGRCRPR